MFKHLVEDNDLLPVMERHGLKLPEDLVFIREQIEGPSDSNAGQTQKVKSGGWQWVVSDVCGDTGCQRAPFFTRSFTVTSHSSGTALALMCH